MPVIAVVGAGQGMGQAIGKLFGKQGFKVALLSRDPAKLAPIVAELANAGIEAAAFPADVTDATSLRAGLAAVKVRFGTIDVLEYSPSNPTLPQAPASQIARDTLQPWLDFQLFGAIAAVAEVLPHMLERKTGTILVTTGASSVRPEMGYAPFAAAGIAMGALRNWALALHAEVAPSGVQVGHVAIGTFIGHTAETSAEAIAPLYWDLHTEREALERVFGRPVPGMKSLRSTAGLMLTAPGVASAAAGSARLRLTGLVASGDEHNSVYVGTKDPEDIPPDYTDPAARAAGYETGNSVDVAGGMVLSRGSVAIRTGDTSSLGVRCGRPAGRRCE